MFITPPEKKSGKGKENICSTREGNMMRLTRLMNLEGKVGLGEFTSK